MMGYKDPQMQKEYHKKWVEKNKERYNEYMKKQMKWRSQIYYYKHVEKKRAASRLYNKKHPDIQLKHKMKVLEKIGKLFDLTAPEYRDAFFYWSKTIKMRDNNKCVVCGYDKTLNAHHLFHKSKYPTLSLNLNNGITLCKLHHREVHGWICA